MHDTTHAVILHGYCMEVPAKCVAVYIVDKISVYIVTSIAVRVKTAPGSVYGIESRSPLQHP